MKNKYDKIIIGAGLYGLYSALNCGKKGEKVVVLGKDPAAFLVVFLFVSLNFIAEAFKTLPLLRKIL